MFLRHRILASTLSLSCPSIARSSVSVRPVKFGGGIGGGGSIGPKKGGIGGMGGKADGAPDTACDQAMKNSFCSEPDVSIKVTSFSPVGTAGAVGKRSGSRQERQNSAHLTLQSRHHRRRHPLYPVKAASSKMKKAAADHCCYCCCLCCCCSCYCYCCWQRRQPRPTARKSFVRLRP